MSGCLNLRVITLATQIAVGVGGVEKSIRFSEGEP